VIKRYHDPSTPYERALAHQEVPKAVKRRLREQYRTLDLSLLAEIRAAQEGLGNRVNRRGANGALTLPAASPLIARLLEMSAGQGAAPNRDSRRPIPARGHCRTSVYADTKIYRFAVNGDFRAGA
jgi:hypothetical protein